MPPPLLIVGAGAAGLAAALRAASLGRAALVLERDGTVPSNTAVSGGLFSAAGTRWQQAAGIDDSAGRMHADITAKTGGKVDQAMLDLVCGRSAQVAHFLADQCGLILHVRQGGLYPGASVHRLHGTPGESGADLLQLLRAAVARTPAITVRDPVDVTGLAVADGRVTGVISADGILVPGDAVLLACGGYGADAALVARWCPEIAGAPHVGAASSRGDAVRWGAALDADLAFMSAYQGHRADPETGLRLGAELPALGAILLNRDGRRFVREDTGPSELAAIIRGQPGAIAVEVFDQHAMDVVQTLGPLRASLAAGAIKRADDAAALARTFDLPADAVAAEFAALCAGAPDRLGRTLTRPPFAPPFYGMKMTGVLAHTQGGLRIDAQARVVRPDGGVIPGLLAAGASAACISGDCAAGYVPGNGLAHALVTGYVAAETMARRG